MSKKSDAMNPKTNYTFSCDMIGCEQLTFKDKRALENHIKKKHKGSVEGSFTVVDINNMTNNTRFRMYKQGDTLTFN